MEIPELETTIDAAVTAAGFELVNCSLSSIGRTKVIRVFIDAPNGISIDDCQKVSRQINAVLEVSDAFSGDYTLEVSSPGMDRALVKPEHYQRFLGSRVKIKLRHDMEGRRNFTGELISANAETISLQVDKKIFELPLSNIEKANIVPNLGLK